MSDTVIKRLRAEHDDGRSIDLSIDLGNKRIMAALADMDDAEAGHWEALIRGFAIDGDVRSALIALRSLGYRLWLEVDEAAIQLLIRELATKGQGQ
jgi:hypothetical protein